MLQFQAILSLLIGTVLQFSLSRFNLSPRGSFASSTRISKILGNTKRVPKKSCLLWFCCVISLRCFYSKRPHPGQINLKFSSNTSNCTYSPFDSSTLVEGRLTHQLFSSKYCSAAITAAWTPIIVSTGVEKLTELHGFTSAAQQREAILWESRFVFFTDI